MGSNADIEMRLFAGRTRSSGVLLNGGYAKYVLVVLVVVNTLNFVDRQILAILADDIKADLGIKDAQLGFLFGTAFAVFYATFGLAFGRLADLWNRTRLIALGLSVWSLMTCMSGFASGFAPLAACRFGVGVGESTATPAAFSLLYDCFSAKVRSIVLGFYTGGVYIGAGLGLFIGGVSLQLWKHTWPIAADAPFGLKGWQAAFMIVGLPGLLMALWVATLREPARGQGDDIVVQDHPRPFYEALLVLGTMLPILNWWTMWISTRNLRAIAINISSLVAIALTVFVMIGLTGDVVQWIGLGIGMYAAISWAQGLLARDPLVTAMIFRCRTMRNVIVAGGTTTFLGVAFAFWSVPFIQRYHGVGPAEAGAILGLSFALMGFLGTALGGWAADALRAVTPRGKLYVWLTGVIICCVAAICFLSVGNVKIAYACIFVMNLSLAAAQGPQFSTINDLCLPRGRATTSAFAYMVATFLGIALGPYVTGHLSDIFAATGLSSGEALRRAMLWSLILPAGGIALVIDALFHVASDEARVRDIALTTAEAA